MSLPEYVGPCAFGIKMGVVLPGSDLKSMIKSEIMKINKDGLLEDNDALCVTESIVARAQENYITTEEIAEEVTDKLNLKPNDTLGVLFPILSRNRFSLILEGLAKAVPRGKIIVQLSHPDDEVGNQLIPPEKSQALIDKGYNVIKAEELEEDCIHPITNVNYLKLYRDIITEQGAEAELFVSNDYRVILDYHPQGVLCADIHTREEHRSKLESKVITCTLQDLFNDSSKESWSEWGLLGSNMSSDNKLKLAPYNADEFACELQKEILDATGKKIEVIIGGDGAYKDPSSGIYELADPKPAFGTTPGLRQHMREGVKYKYLIDMYHNQGKSEKEIQEIIAKESEKKKGKNHEIETEGTTPRKIEDILASLADLVSGSADAGTPVILIKSI
ncbi:coenzyme F420-0:L-glutamate ligase [Natranaerobius thermophilus]|uniref:Coenzyme F420:L-glutamate ligase-like domain-containing protein n=1 Tax=Natranaerobius thermophilus (strain ATCC BAA-1301 / DSM 18059 / JW/NM-WN-LF) TaxID=457570 RepID=B2A778_NATTJ|nr:coenzyme F420-0:L-glutamate ligase [Natranaerobius thermophilus]ACB84272.1 conserved hypothetical protein [Natranaerobius thermophilus JW/NM-WN-LF]